MKAELFITVASRFFVVAAMRMAWPASVRAASMRKPIPPPK